MHDLLARCYAQASLHRRTDDDDERQFTRMVRACTRKRACADAGTAWAEYAGMCAFARVRRMRVPAALALWPQFRGDVACNQADFERFSRGSEDRSLQQHGEWSVTWFEQPHPQHKHGDWRWACAPALLERARAATARVAGDCPPQLRTPF